MKAGFSERWARFSKRSDRSLAIRISPWFFVWLVFPAAIIHGWWAYCWHSGAPISALGGLVAIFGGVTALRPIFRLGVDKAYNDASGVNGGIYDEASPRIDDKKLDFMAIYVTGASLAFVGALINTYGGFVGDYLFK